MLYIWVLKENESSILFWFQVLYIYYIHFHVKELALIIACLKELTTKYWDKKKHILKSFKVKTNLNLFSSFSARLGVKNILQFLKGSELHKATP